MNDPTFFDRLRDWSQGRLPTAEALQFERELEEDPQKARLADEYLDVEHWLVVGEFRPHDQSIGRAPPRSEVSWDQLAERIAAEPPRSLPPADDASELPAPRDRRARPDPASARRKLPTLGRPSRRWIAAVASAAALLFALWSRHDLLDTGRPTISTTPAVAVLEAIPWQPAENSPSEFPLAALQVLEREPEPLGSQPLWHEDRNVAEAVASLSDRPLLSVAGFADAKCEKYLEIVLGDPDVEALLETCVLVRAIWKKSEVTPKQKNLATWGRYPVVEVSHASSGLQLDLSGIDRAHKVASELDRVLAPIVSSSLDSQECRDWSEVAISAREEEQAGWFGRADELYTDLVEFAAGGFTQLGQEGRDRIGTHAAETLRAALDASSVDGCLAKLTSSQFDGTPFQSDLDRVREIVERTGRIPRIESPQ